MEESFISEMNVGWLYDYYERVSEELFEWEEDDEDRSDFIRDIFVQCNTLLNDGIDMRIYEKFNNCEEIIATASRLFKCRELNAFEIKPCWDVYTKLQRETRRFNIEPLDAGQEYTQELNAQLSLLHDAFELLKGDLASAEEFIDLNEKDKLIFNDIILSLNCIEKPDGAHRKSSLLYTAYLRAIDYCNCQGNTGVESCLPELDKLIRAVNAYLEPTINSDCAEDE